MVSFYLSVEINRRDVEIRHLDGSSFYCQPFAVLFLSSFSGGGVPHRTRIFAAWNVLAARIVKSTGILGFGTKKVTTTSIVVPGVNAGMLTTALVGVPTTVSDCKPVPALTWSTVTVPGPLDTPKETMPPGNPLGIYGTLLD